MDNFLIKKQMMIENFKIIVANIQQKKSCPRDQITLNSNSSFITESCYEQWAHLLLITISTTIISNICFFHCWFQTNLCLCRQSARKASNGAFVLLLHMFFGKILCCGSNRSTIIMKFLVLLSDTNNMFHFQVFCS